MRITEEQIQGPLDPFVCHRQLAGGAPSVLLDGNASMGSLATRAYVLFDPFEIVSAAASSDRESSGPDPLARLFSRMNAIGTGGGSGIFRGGAAGYLSYDIGRHLEKIPATASVSTCAPDLWFGLFNRGLEIDLRTGVGTLFVCEIPDTERAGSDYVQGALEAAHDALSRESEPLPTPADCGALVSNFHRESYLNAVGRVREYIRNGDVYQVNLSQRFQAEYAGSYESLYCRLRQINPSPFAAMVNTGDVKLLSSSPERLISRTGDEIETRPIKGTRRRTGDAARDDELIEELLSSEKDAAELAMIVDLERNDLGRVARYGSVRVEDPGRLETYPTVFHRVAVVRATLREGCGSEELLRAVYPGGSITGAPKIRAMEIIEELEEIRRGPFTGSIGWIGFNGDLDLNIAIRTLVLEPGMAHFHVGGGVVLDSDPEEEYEETLTKGRALARALGSSLP